jgi:branched-chain amino acid transport system substrate-binding protein
MNMRKHLAVALALGLVAWLTAGGAPLAQAPEIKIGAIFPLSGPAAKSGEDTVNALRLAVEIVNGKFDLPLPLAKTEGLPRLGGAKVKLIVSDHQGQPEIGAADAERLITREKVAAIVGAYYSSVAATSSQVAERYGIPYVTGESEASNLTERGFKWFFRTTPSSFTQAKDYFDFLADLNKRGRANVKTIAVIHENTLWGEELAKSAKKYFADYPQFTLVADIAYANGTTDLTSEVQRLLTAKPDVVLHACYEGEAILLAKTYKLLGFNPQGTLTHGAGFVSSRFREALKEDSNYFLAREHWSRDLAASKPVIRAVNDLYKQRFAKEMDGTPARAFTGIMVLLDAINRAGSTQPEAIRKALSETNLSAEQIIMPWPGIKFDAKGQNTMSRGIIVQNQAANPRLVWPFEGASADLIWPRPAWK